MARLYIISFVAVVFVALAGLIFHLSAEKTAYATVGLQRCFNYAGEWDNVVRDTLRSAYGESGYHVQEILMYDFCTGDEVFGLAVNYSQYRPLEDYFRFESYNGSVYAHVGGPEPKIGYTQYWICPDGRSRAMMSGIELCNTL